jgi:hypothetical protein
MQPTRGNFAGSCVLRCRPSASAVEPRSIEEFMAAAIMVRPAGGCTCRRSTADWFVEFLLRRFDYR